MLQIARIKNKVLLVYSTVNTVCKLFAKTINFTQPLRSASHIDKFTSYIYVKKDRSWAKIGE